MAIGTKGYKRCISITLRCGLTETVTNGMQLNTAKGKLVKDVHESKATKTTSWHVKVKMRYGNCVLNLTWTLFTKTC